MNLIDHLAERSRKEGGVCELQLSPEHRPLRVVFRYRGKTSPFWNNRTHAVDPVQRDSELASLDSLYIKNGILCGECSKCYYSDYIRTNAILTTVKSGISLAIGVHAMLECGGRVVVLEDSRGNLSLPGGAVDAADAAAGIMSLHQALVREIYEETNISIPVSSIDFTRAFVGGKIMHFFLLAYARIEIADLGALEGYQNRAEDIERVSLLGIEELSRLPESKKALALRLALSPSV